MSVASTSGWQHLRACHRLHGGFTETGASSFSESTVKRFARKLHGATLTLAPAMVWNTLHPTGSMFLVAVISALFSFSVSRVVFVGAHRGCRFHDDICSKSRQGGRGSSSHCDVHDGSGGSCCFTTFAGGAFANLSNTPLVPSLPRASRGSWGSAPFTVAAPRNVSDHCCGPSCEKLRKEYMHKL
jgi:hypothetical protein